MTVQTQTGNQILSNFAAAVQGTARALVDFSVGSILRALGQATQAIALWLQGIALQIAALTRFQTSNGADADSWGADFGFTRLPAQAATGSVTFSRFTPTAQASIPVGTQVQTADGSVVFEVIADSTQSAYDAGLNAYVIAANAASCTATVEAVTAGAAGNVAAGTLTQLGTAIAGVDTVTNALAFANGADAESDPAMKARFIVYLASLAKATPAAVKTAATSTQQDATAAIVENQAYAGGSQPGYFYVVADDGSGDPSSNFLSAVANNVEATRPIGTSYGIFGPTVVDATIVLTVTAASGYTHTQVAALVQTAIESYVNALALGATLYYTRLIQVAYDASPGVQDVSALTVNGGTSDVTVTAKQVLKTVSVTVN
jgi:uncharacterized phage protein gp47/JayE